MINHVRDKSVFLYIDITFNLSECHILLTIGTIGTTTAIAITTAAIDIAIVLLLA